MRRLVIVVFLETVSERRFAILDRLANRHQQPGVGGVSEEIRFGEIIRIMDVVEAKVLIRIRSIHRLERRMDNQKK